MGLYWNVWIVVLAPSYEDKITSGLVNLGMEVQPLSGDQVNTNSTSKNSGVTLAYRVCDPKGHLIAELSKKIEFILQKNKMFYFSLIVSEATQYCSWYGSNISYPETKSSDKKTNKKSILN